MDLIDILGFVVNVIAVILAGMVIIPYFINRVFYAGEVNITWEGQDIEGAMVNGSRRYGSFGLTTESKGRILVRSVFVSIGHHEKLKGFTIYDVFGSPALPHDLVQRGAGFAFSFLIWKDSYISKGHGQLLNFGYEPKGDNIDEIQFRITVISQRYEGDLPYLIDMFPARIYEQTFFKTIKIRND